jgi:hypothetical protein
MLNDGTSLDQVELTPPKAAEYLGVSVAFLDGLLATGELPYRMAETGQWISFADLREWRCRDDLERAVAADELLRLSQEMRL